MVNSGSSIRTEYRNMHRKQWMIDSGEYCEWQLGEITKWTFIIHGQTSALYVSYFRPIFPCKPFNDIVIQPSGNRNLSRTVDAIFLILYNYSVCGFTISFVFLSDAYRIFSDIKKRFFPFNWLINGRGTKPYAFPNTMSNRTATKSCFEMFINHIIFIFHEKLTSISEAAQI